MEDIAMELLKLSVVVLFLSLMLVPTVFDRVVFSQSGGTGSPTTDPDTPLTEKQSADLAATTDEANKVSGSDANAANDPVDSEGVAAGSTDTFSYDPDTDPAAANSKT